MGTYTTNYQLYMPSIGEQGWGTLVNGNFETIDAFLKPISLSGSTYTFTGNIVGNQSGGTITATKITNSGTSTFTGKITANGGIGTTSLTTSSTITSTGQIVANGGIKGNLTGNVTGNTTGFLFVKGTVGTSGDENYATLAAQSGTIANGGQNNVTTVTINNYSIVYANPKKHAVGIYTRRSDLSGTTSPNAGTRTVTFTNNHSMTSTQLGYKLSTASTYSYTNYISANGGTITLSLQAGKTYNFYSHETYVSLNYSIPAGTTYKVKYATP